MGISITNPSGGGGGSGATTALDNLASVAINEALISDTDATDDLGSASAAWKRLYLEAGAADEVPLNIELATTHTGNAINVTSQGGTAGDIFKVSASGDVTMGAPNRTFTSNGSSATVVFRSAELRLTGNSHYLSLNNGNFRPSQDAAVDLGTASFNFKDVYIAGYPIIDTHTPASASDTGTTGSIAWDSTYLYVCVATDTWQRVTHATW